MKENKAGKLSICGPVKDGQFTVWVVRGPKGGQLGEFITRAAATRFVKTHRKFKVRKELLHAGN